MSISLFGQSNQKIELFDLLTMFIPENENTCKDWFTGADENSPIVWETEGANYEDAYSKDLMLGSFGRKGKVIITINENPLFILAKKKEIVEWDIKIFGPRIGIYALYISNNILGQANCFDNDCVKSYFTKKGASIKLLRGNYESVSSGKLFYEINIKNKPRVFLTIDFSCGSAGCGGDYLFQFYEPNNKYFKKQELVNTKCK
jgi:hypothetical protein